MNDRKATKLLLRYNYSRSKLKEAQAKTRVGRIKRRGTEGMRDKNREFRELLEAFIPSSQNEGFTRSLHLVNLNP